MAGIWITEPYQSFVDFPRTQSILRGILDPLPKRESGIGSKGGLREPVRSCLRCAVRRNTYSRLCVLPATSQSKADPSSSSSSSRVPVILFHGEGAASGGPSRYFARAENSRFVAIDTCNLSLLKFLHVIKEGLEKVAKGLRSRMSGVPSSDVTRSAAAELMVLLQAEQEQQEDSRSTGPAASDDPHSEFTRIVVLDDSESSYLDKLARISVLTPETERCLRNLALSETSVLAILMATLFKHSGFDFTADNRLKFMKSYVHTRLYYNLMTVGSALHSEPHRQLSLLDDPRMRAYLERIERETQMFRVVHQRVVKKTLQLDESDDLTLFYSVEAKYAALRPNRSGESDHLGATAGEQQQQQQQQQKFATLAEMAEVKGTAIAMSLSRHVHELGRLPMTLVHKISEHARPSCNRAKLMRKAILSGDPERHRKMYLTVTEQVVLSREKKAKILDSITKGNLWQAEVAAEKRAAPETGSSAETPSAPKERNYWECPLILGDLEYTTKECMLRNMYLAESDQNFLPVIHPTFYMLLTSSIHIDYVSLSHRVGERGKAPGARAAAPAATPDHLGPGNGGFFNSHRTPTSVYLNQRDISTRWWCCFTGRAIETPLDGVYVIFWFADLPPVVLTVSYALMVQENCRLVDRLERCVVENSAKKSNFNSRGKWVPLAENVPLAEVYLRQYTGIRKQALVRYRKAVSELRFQGVPVTWDRIKSSLSESDLSVMAELNDLFNAESGLADEYDEIDRDAMDVDGLSDADLGIPSVAAATTSAVAPDATAAAAAAFPSAAPKKSSAGAKTKRAQSKSSTSARKKQAKPSSVLSKILDMSQTAEENELGSAFDAAFDNGETGEAKVREPEPAAPSSKAEKKADASEVSDTESFNGGNTHGPAAAAASDPAPSAKRAEASSSSSPAPSKKRKREAEPDLSSSSEEQTKVKKASAKDKHAKSKPKPKPEPKAKKNDKHKSRSSKKSSHRRRGKADSGSGSSDEDSEDSSADFSASSESDESFSSESDEQSDGGSSAGSSASASASSSSVSAKKGRKKGGKTKAKRVKRKREESSEESSAAAASSSSSDRPKAARKSKHASKSARKRSKSSKSKHPDAMDLDSGDDDDDDEGTSKDQLQYLTPEERAACLDGEDLDGQESASSEDHEAPEGYELIDYEGHAHPTSYLINRAVDAKTAMFYDGKTCGIKKGIPYSKENDHGIVSVDCKLIFVPDHSIMSTVVKNLVSIFVKLPKPKLSEICSGLLDTLEKLTDPTNEKYFTFREPIEEMNPASLQFKAFTDLRTVLMLLFMTKNQQADFTRDYYKKYKPDEYSGKGDGGKTKTKKKFDWAAVWEEVKEKAADTIWPNAMFTRFIPRILADNMIAWNVNMIKKANELEKKVKNKEMDVNAAAQEISHNMCRHARGYLAMFFLPLKIDIMAPESDKSDHGKKKKTNGKKSSEGKSKSKK